MTCRGRRRRLVGVLVLALGIIGMHSLVIAPGHAMAHPPELFVHHQVEVAESVAKSVDACDCTGHNGFHACVFVLTSAIVMAALALLYWIGVTIELRVPARLRELLRRRQRAPPWTVLTLAELSVLRI